MTGYSGEIAEAVEDWRKGMPVLDKVYGVGEVFEIDGVRHIVTGVVYNSKVIEEGFCVSIQESTGEQVWCRFNEKLKD